MTVIGSQPVAIENLLVSFLLVHLIFASKLLSVSLVQTHES